MSLRNGTGALPGRKRPPRIESTSSGSHARSERTTMRLRSSSSASSVRRARRRSWKRGPPRTNEKSRASGGRRSPIAGMEDLIGAIAPPCAPSGGGDNLPDGALATSSLERCKVRAMRASRTLLAASLALLAAPGARAQDACAEDVKRLCGKVEPGGGRVDACLQQNLAA